MQSRRTRAWANRLRVIPYGPHLPKGASDLLYEITTDLRKIVRIVIAVTNTWHNRLVGDEQHPADFEWGEERGGLGRAMKAYPDWFLKNQPRPEQNRKCFVIWYYHRKDSPLLPAGLLGPVRLVPMQAKTSERR